MVNLTADFVTIVEMVEKENGIERKAHTHTSLINDTFVKEAIDLYTHTIKLSEYLTSIRPEYLLSSTSKYDISTTSKMTEEQRNEIDTQARLELRAFTKRLKLLETYEQKRCASRKYFRFNKSQASAVNTHRAGILMSLNHELRVTSKLLLEMQETRLSRHRDLDAGSDRLKNLNVPADKYSLISEDKSTWAAEPEFDVGSLSQEQLQVLEEERSVLLDGKLEDLEKVQEIHKGVLEISQLEAQLASHLQVQNDSIKSLVNDHDMTEVDIVGGHKILKKAKAKGNFAAKTVMGIAFAFGCILLVFDAIN